MSQDTRNRENECLDNNQIIEANTVKNSDKNENKIKIQFKKPRSYK